MTIAESPEDYIEHYESNLSPSVVQDIQEKSFSTAVQNSKLISNKRQRNWTDELIKSGIDKFIEENGKMPTAADFDTTPYLPSARQVQRLHGGLAKIKRGSATKI